MVAVFPSEFIGKPRPVLVIQGDAFAELASRAATALRHVRSFATRKAAGGLNGNSSDFVM